VWDRSSPVNSVEVGGPKVEEVAEKTSAPGETGALNGRSTRRRAERC
jgi:hypothetical protein